MSAIGGLDEPEGSLVRGKRPFPLLLRSHADLLRAAGARPHRPVLIVPGFMSSGLRCIEGRWPGGRVWLDVAKLFSASGASLEAPNPPRTLLAHLALGGERLDADPMGIRLEPLQGLAGIVIAAMIKNAAPHLEVVNHHDVEGLPMLQAYESRLERLKTRPAAATVTLPYYPAAPEKVASAAGQLPELLKGYGPPPPIAVAQRGIVPSAARVSASEPILIEAPRPARRPSQTGAQTGIGG